MDSCFKQLNAQLKQRFHEDQQSSKKSRFLIWIDENYQDGDLDIAGLKAHVHVVTNRIDTARTLEKQGITTVLSDFKLGPECPKFSAIFFRVSKERLLSHRCINLSLRSLKKRGTLCIVGRKEDGIKTYFNRCIKDLELQGDINKTGDSYVANLAFDTDASSKKNFRDAQLTLDDGDYKELRKAADLKLLGNKYVLYSKPGVYGWKKVDAGTQYLVEQVAANTAQAPAKASALDLGCGSGHLALFAHALGYKHITASDNNVAAVAATKRTLKENNVKAKVLLADAGDTLDTVFDLILCNPPFHKGFSTDSSLTQKFIFACRRLLSPRGSAFFVTNSFIAIEKEMFKAGLKGTQIANNSRFKVLKITLR